MKHIFDLGELFERVQMEQIFTDSKTFVDCIPKAPLADINQKYEAEKHHPNFDLKTFVDQYFELPPTFHTDFHTQKDIPLHDHIDNLWDVLTRHIRESKNSLIALPEPYIVPGGRFREMFYWDSYFTMLGLAESGRFDLIESMIKNFAYLINQYGYIPNGNRAYFLGRSQPPFFVLMIELLASKKGAQVWEQYLPYLEKEYTFWMAGKDQITSDYEALRRTVRLPGSIFMNRYWDENHTPRPEAYKKDMDWAADISDKSSFFRHERAACESGWDFSGRWYQDGNDIAHNRCADFCPIDLNCLLYYLEKKIAEHTADAAKKDAFSTAASRRKDAIRHYFWNDDRAFFFDFNFRRRAQSDEWSIAAAFPLFVTACNQMEADAVSRAIREKFLKTGGVLTTLKMTGQQWDAPNGWAPLEWVAISGLHNFNHNDLAAEIARRWMHTNETIFRQTGKMMEKYNVEEKGTHAVAGTYPTQDGFGWTNGVYLACRRLLADLTD